MDLINFYDFLRDPKLIELIELNKTTDDLLDVIDLHENQHSKVLAWCMNPNEGHSQGDAVIKEFLEAAYHGSIDRIYDNKKFFSKWTPGKIRTCSFGSAFVTREFNIKVENGTRNGRLDLFLIDHQNKMLVAIENKSGSKLNSDQLDKYVAAVKKEVLSRNIFSGYDCAFVVLDRDLSSYSDEHIIGFGKRWVLLDYSWLRSSAERAGFQLASGRNAAQLLVSYCQKQTEWESPSEKRTSELAADLAVAHPRVIEEIRKTLKLSVREWTMETMKGAGGELTWFCAQHSEVCKQLMRIQGIATIVHQIIKSTNVVDQDNIRTYRTWFCAMPKAALKFQESSDSDWPLFVSLSRIRDSSSDAPRYSLRLVWARAKFGSSAEEASLRKIIASTYPDLNKFTTSDRRYILIDTNLSMEESIQKTKSLLESISDSIQRYNQDS